jgi:DNA sulfur modification protein DndD
MILKSLKLTNWRQFYGDTPRLEFDPREDRNVTVIHGGNGSGKTALLNAFTWVLYGKTSGRFQSEDDIVNRRALHEAPVGDLVAASGTVGFEHGEYRFEITRERKVERTPLNENQQRWRAMGPDRITMIQTHQATGDTESVLYPRELIEKILPTELYGYFFFDGEDLGDFGTKANRDNLQRAAEKLTRIDLFKQTIKALKPAKKSLSNALTRIGDVEVDRLQTNKQTLENDKDNLEARIDERKTNIAKIVTHLAVIEQKLMGLKETRELQEERRTKETEVENLKTEIKQLRVDIGQVLSSEAYQVFLPNALEQFRAMIDDLKAKGELPSGIKQEFVQTLLEEHRCICKRDLDDAAEQALKDWLAKAGLTSVEENATKLSGAVRVLEEPSTESILQRLNEFQSAAVQKKKQITLLEDRLDQLHKLIGENQREDIAQLETSRQKLIGDKRLENDEILRADGQIQVIDEQIDNLTSEIDERAERSEELKIAQKRLRITEDFIKRADKVRDTVKTDFRNEIEAEMQPAFAAMSNTNYRPVLSSNWLLSLDSEGAVALGAGGAETQALNLSFITSIVAKQEAWLTLAKNIFGEGDDTHLPLVVDSPFGQLDSQYRTTTPAYLAKALDQLILLASNSQWKGEVEQVLSPKVSKQYVLTYYNPRQDVEKTFIAIGDQQYVLQDRLEENELEYTEIQEVTNA